MRQSASYPSAAADFLEASPGHMGSRHAHFSAACYGSYRSVGIYVLAVNTTRLAGIALPKHPFSSGRSSSTKDCYSTSIMHGVDSAIHWTARFCAHAITCRTLPSCYGSHSSCVVSRCCGSQGICVYTLPSCCGSDSGCVVRTHSPEMVRNASNRPPDANTRRWRAVPVLSDNARNTVAKGR
jgi:hypothetical protein